MYGGKPQITYDQIFIWGFSKEIKSIIIIMTFHRLPFIFKVLIQSLPLIIFVFLKSIEFVRYYDYKNIDFVSCNINIYIFFIEETDWICQVFNMILLKLPNEGEGKSHC